MWNCWKSDQMFAGKWPTFTPTHEPGHIFKIGNIPSSRLVSRNWCLAITMGITFWVWCNLGWLHYGNSFIALQFIESNIALHNKLVHSLVRSNMCFCIISISIASSISISNTCLGLVFVCFLHEFCTCIAWDGLSCIDHILSMYGEGGLPDLW